MNLLARTLIEKAGYSNGWENVLSSSSDEVVMTSARHDAEARVRPSLTTEGDFVVSFPQGPAVGEMAISFPGSEKPSGKCVVAGLGMPGSLLRRAAELAMSLPNHTADLYAVEVSKIELNPPSTTEAIRLVKQRVGQDLFRHALMKYRGDLRRYGPGARGYLPGVARLEVAEPFLSFADLVGIKTSPSSLAVQGNPCVKTAAGFTDVESGSPGRFPLCGFLLHDVAKLGSLWRYESGITQ
jgi:hypothetical protein